MALQSAAPKLAATPTPATDVEIVYVAIGNNPVFFKHLLTKEEAELEHAVFGMSEDQLKAVDRLRAEKDHKASIDAFAALCEV